MKAPSFISLDRRPALDLRFQHFSHMHRGIRIIGTWWMDEESGSAEPCLVLMDGLRPMRRGRVIPCVIRLSDMWAWTREEGEPAYIAEAIADWMRSGAMPGNPHSKPDVIRIYDAVQSRLRDLYAMPPAPVGIAVKHGAVPIGVMEVVERGTGQTINQVELVSRNVRPS